MQVNCGLLEVAYLSYAIAGVRITFPWWLLLLSSTSTTCTTATSPASPGSGVSLALLFESVSEPRHYNSINSSLVFIW